MEKIAVVFQSLDDVTRLRILALLLKESELCVCDLVAVLQLPQSTVSRHLSLLKNSGWLTDRRHGLWIYYSINRSLAPVQQFLVPVLVNFVSSSQTAKDDLDRLENLSRGNCCA
ncbi:helix-turn-helix transcriptional regulator, ArsR family [Geotalea daltonii FRC-32]|uniref:Helix-turn-helix transcriptional regulator, ArsR family n=1 Tax=Geotalea daltonii (strain DSM 22248 / JCM 15807 / FRC-32) TaxID=316067 RepID=B9M9J5_GEODF|nr:metalloregulator ArsR/SmtB family transcription factor [Geotalea daltonii]ACM20567.1 helix-turn-helix transcriptional regulator, ArsR family [Geotalea daltonii FRC-32]